MLKKFSILIFLFIICFTLCKSMSALSLPGGQYKSFLALNCNSGKLIKDYKQDEINQALSKIKRKLFGYEIYQLNNNLQVDFISEVVYSFYNDGDTPIEYSIDINEQVQTKTQYSLTGSLKTEASGTIKKISLGLTSKLDSSYDFEATISTKAQEKIKLEVDPHTICIMYYEGSALVTNGVAKKYSFYIPSETGTFEIFTITNINLRIEKVRI